MTAQLVTDALVMAIWRRGKPDALLHHSDRGSQYTSEQFPAINGRSQRRLFRMSRSGNVSDNAAMESFFSFAGRPSELRAKCTERGIKARAGVFGLHRALLQSKTPALDDRIFKPYGVREAGWISLSGCQQNRV